LDYSYHVLLVILLLALGANLQNYQYAYVLADIQRTPIILDIEKKSLKVFKIQDFK